MVTQSRTFDTIIVGGGLAGLTSAALLSSAGQNVAVIERRAGFGGRGASHRDENGFIFNQGPHALYNGGPARKVFDRLGIQMTGSYPARNLKLLLNGRLAPLPGNLPDILFSQILSLKAKVELIGFLSGINSINCESIANIDFESWAAKRFRDVDTRKLVRALVRVSTYAEGLDYVSAGAAMTQLRVAFKGVTYLDGGWQSLVDQLVEICQRNDVALLNSVHAQSLLHNSNDSRIDLHLSTDELISGTNLVVALPPASTRELLGVSNYVREVTSNLVPIRAACLDLALKNLPHDDLTFVLNLDKPYYYSVHSAYAKLAESGVLLHVMKYLSPSDSADESVQMELEQYLDELQPGWRNLVIHRRFLPSMVVSNKVHNYRVHNPADVEVPDLANVFLVGDWISDEGMLLDAAIASAAKASRTILQQSPARQREIVLTSEPAAF